MIHAHAGFSRKALRLSCLLIASHMSGKGVFGKESGIITMDLSAVG